MGKIAPTPRQPPGPRPVATGAQLRWPPSDGRPAQAAPLAPRLRPSGRVASPGAKPAITILDACRSDALFRRWFRDLSTWTAWFVLLKALFAFAMTASDLALFRQCTGRDAPPPGGFLEAWLICGRRAGKSFILALIAVFLACFRDWSRCLAPGERGVVMVIAADRRQARVIFRYCRALLRVPALASFIEAEKAEQIDLVNNLSIEILTASFRATRGYTLIAALLDEVAVWRNEEGAANLDSEILTAIRPAMATVPGAMLLCASSPYARRGILYDAFRRWHAQEDAKALVWMADTRTMNGTVSQDFIDAEFERDPQAAASEYGRDGHIEFRADVEGFVATEAVDAAVVPGRIELPPVPGMSYVGFADAAGGSGQDSFTAAVAHRDEQTGRLVLDAVRERRPPFSPEAAVAELAEFFVAYGVREIVCDRWGGQFPVEAFAKHGITCKVSERVKSDIYKELLSPLNSGAVELLDHKRLIAQLYGLERRTARGGKDSIDHAPGGRDDVINAAAGALLLAANGAVAWSSPKLTTGLQDFENSVLGPPRRVAVEPPPAGPGQSTFAEAAEIIRQRMKGKR